jgi:pyrroline-5-carboxylate reductase
MTEAHTTPALLPPILLVGCGRMGGAMLTGWRENGLAPSFAVDPAASAESLGGSDITVVNTAAALPDDFRPAAVIFAVKPQNASETLPDYRRYAEQSVFLSIMAGRTTAGLRENLSDAACIVRAMPNTPAAIRQGITVAYPTEMVTADQRDLCHRLLQAIGQVAWVDDEALLDPVTAVSGSGPAYIFLLAEVMEHAAVRQGIPRDLARLLARQTVAGSGGLLGASADDAADLRKAVTSPGGTTAAALAVLMDQAAWPDLMDRAVAAATQRSRELAG